MRRACILLLFLLLGGISVCRTIRLRRRVEAQGKGEKERLPVLTVALPFTLTTLLLLAAISGE